MCVGYVRLRGLVSGSYTVLVMDVGSWGVVGVQWRARDDRQTCGEVLCGTHGSDYGYYSTASIIILYE